MDPPDFDTVVTDDHILSHVLKFIPPSDVATCTALVNKRWARVALHGPVHAPLAPCLITALRFDLESRRVVRWRMYCALSLRNLLRDPYFVERPKIHPADPFRECPWVCTKNPGQGTIFEGDTPNGMDAPAPCPRPPWGRVSNNTRRPHYLSMASKGGEVTQVVDLVGVLHDRGIDKDIAARVLDASPSFGFSIYVGSRRDSDTAFSVHVVLDAGTRPLPYYQTAKNDAFSRSAIALSPCPVLLPERNRWRRYACTLESYGPGVRRAVVSLRGKGVDQTDQWGPKFASPELVVLSAGDTEAWMKEDGEWLALQLDSLRRMQASCCPSG